MLTVNLFPKFGLVYSLLQKKKIIKPTSYKCCLIVLLLKVIALLNIVYFEFQARCMYFYE